MVDDRVTGGINLLLYHHAPMLAYEVTKLSCRCGIQSFLQPLVENESVAEYVRLLTDNVLYPAVRRDVAALRRLPLLDESIVEQRYNSFHKLLTPRK